VDVGKRQAGKDCEKGGYNLAFLKKCASDIQELWDRDTSQMTSSQRIKEQNKKPKSVNIDFHVRTKP